ncbi:MAG: hypothetical protein HY221_02730, partial [Candidatus Sungbacteria bacterium]|nr:hypothetical protein [Candidatus Sungbacteria bacterium]
GAYLLALDSKIAVESTAGTRILEVFKAGKEFLGGRAAERKCETYNDPDPYAEVQNHTTCHTEYNTKTPGGLIADTLSKAVGSGIDFAVVADEIQEAIATVVNSLINKMISETYTAINSSNGEDTSGRGIYDPGASRLPFGADQLQDSRFFKQVPNFIFTADVAVATINQIAASTQQNLFSLREQINNTNAQIQSLQAQDPTSSDPVIQAQIRALQANLVTLRSSQADLATRLSTQLGQQAAILASEGELAAIHRTLVTDTTADEIARTADQLEPAINRLQQAANQIPGVPQPIVATGNVKQDTLAQLANAKSNVQDEKNLYQAILAEMDQRIATSTTSTATKNTLIARRPDVTSQASRLSDALASLQRISDTLTAATDDAVIKSLRKNAIAQIVVADGELKSANTLMTSIEPILREP